jgi:hypothetical protein
MRPQYQIKMYLNISEASDNSKDVHNMLRKDSLPTEGKMIEIKVHVPSTENTATLGTQKAFTAR